MLSLIQSPERPVSDRLEETEILAAALTAISPRRRDAFVLKYFEGLDGGEAAQHMGIEPGAYRVLLTRALVDLRASVAEALGETV